MTIKRFILLILVTAFGIESQAVSVKNREDAVKFYEQKLEVIEFNDYEKEVNFDFSAVEDLVNQDLSYLHFFHDTGVIHLGGKNITDESFMFFEVLLNLRVLTFDDTKIKGEGVKYLSKLTKLERFIANNTPFTDKGLEYLSKIKFEKLIEVQLTNTKITDEGLKYLSKIKLTGALYLANTKITDEGLKYLSNQKDLAEIDLRGTKVTKAGAQWLEKQLPNTGIEYGKYVPQRD